MPVRWISWVNVALGLWLATSAFAIRHTPGPGVPEGVIAGLIAALAAFWAAGAFRPVISLLASWTVVLTGLWIAVAPLVLNYNRHSAAFAGDVIVGLAIVAFAMINTVAKGRRWQALQ